jgi:glycolate oxidase
VGNATAASGRAYFICDTTVPRTSIPEMQVAVHQVSSRYSLDISFCGHAGDGNIHPIVLYDGGDAAEARACEAASLELVELALALGGTLTGEHGVGSEKRALMRLRFSAAEISAMRHVKRTFDPEGLLNPGVLLPDADVDEPRLPLFGAACEAALSTPARAERLGIPSPSVGSEDITIDTANLTLMCGGATCLVEVGDSLDRIGWECSLLDGGRRLTVAEALQADTHREGARDSLLAISAQLPDGPVVRFGSAAVKDVAGYDLKRLYIGSGNAFGHLGGAIFRIAPAG